MTTNLRITWFSERTRKKIVEEAKRILDEIGVFVENDEALSLLDGAGARIERDKRRARIPASLVERAVESAPSKIAVYNRYGESAMELAGDRIHFNPGSAALRIFDAGSGRARAAVTADLVRFVELTDALPAYAAQSTGLISTDVPQEIQDRYRLYLGLLHSSKPVVTGTFRVDGFKVMHEMLAAVAGDADRLREKPMAIFDCCPSPPLKWSDLTAQALIDCARTGIIAELISMPLTGATSPVTLAGAVTQHCAECLSGVVIHQLATPGAPIIYGGSPACFDMRKGTAPMGAVETMMIDGAYAEIGKHLGLPVQAYMALSDSKVVDYQAGMETAMGAVIAALSGINNISGPGMLDFESCQSLEKLVLDNEVCSMALRLASGIELRDDPIVPLELMREGIERKSFLSLPHTLKWFRKEAYFPDEVIDRNALDEWQKQGSKDAARRSSERVEKILAAHKPAPLDEAVAAHLRGLIETEAKRFGMKTLPGTS
ncbi:MAG: trimethylamine methyltransferase family protein [Candidatus Krumholzibacteria bacterium]|nr:trimethylamine methyltransferase family protein [Candidatus Krumholzibacteria bacterium]